MKKPIPFGKYVLLDRISVGGMAEVFLAKAFGAAGFERILAIKKILPTMVEDEEFITMFIDEARIAVQLNHSNIVQIHELGKNDEHYYIAIEYVPGRDLRAVLDQAKKRKHPIPIPLAVFLAQKVCEGLDYAHRKRDAQGRELNIVHRDISPQNVLIAFEGDVKVIDFGIAKAQGRLQKTQAGILKGKFGYMSPEQVRGLPVDRRSDIFALGVIIYEMLTGERLFVGESDFSTLEKVRNAEVLSPREYNDTIPDELDRVVMKSLAREPDDRYQWASDLGEDLMRFLVAGGTVFGQKQLGLFMKEAFANDVQREQERMARFAAEVERESTHTDSAPAPAPSAPLPAAQIRASPPTLDLDSLPGPDSGDDEPGAERTQMFRPEFALGAALQGPPDPSISADARELQTVDRPLPALRTDAAAPRSTPPTPAFEGSARNVGVRASATGPLALESVGRGRALENKTVIRVDPSGPKAPLRMPPASASAKTLPPTPAGAASARTLPPTLRPLPGRPVEASSAPGADAADRPRKPLPPAALAGIGAAAVAMAAVLAFALMGRRPSSPPGGTLVIYPHPSAGARIEVDGRPLEEAEHHAFVARALSPGDHLVAARNGSGLREIHVSVEPGKVIPMDVAMAAPPPTPAAAVPPPVPVATAEGMGLDLTGVRSLPIALSLDSDPPGAEIFVDRVSVGHAPYVLSPVDPRHVYRLKATGPGRKPAQRSGRFDHNESLTLVLPAAEERAEPAERAVAPHHRAARSHGPPGTLIISSHPSAKVFIDGRPTDRYTPVPPSDPIEVPSGEHVIHLQSDDGKKADRRISVQPHGMTKLINVVLD